MLRKLFGKPASNRSKMVIPELWDLHPATIARKVKENREKERKLESERKEKESQLFQAKLKLAKESNDAKLHNHIGNCYRDGIGVKQDHTQAFAWYKKAADQGNIEAQNNLGVCYEHGRGTEQDQARAFTCYINSAEQGYAEAQNNVGDCFRVGFYVTKDQAQAVTWYLKAAEQGDANAQNHLAVCYENGEGVTPDYNKSFEWYQKAAIQRYKLGQRNTGQCYEKGIGVTQDYGKAMWWYREAAEQGDEIAKKRLEALQKQGHQLASVNAVFSNLISSQKTQTSLSEGASLSLIPQLQSKPKKDERLATGDSTQGQQPEIAAFPAARSAQLRTNTSPDVKEQGSISPVSPASANALSKVSPETLEALSNVPAPTLQAVGQVAPEMFLTLAKGRPKIFQALMDMGEDKEQAELEYEEIQQIPALQDFYDFFQRGVISWIAGSLSVQSKMVEDIRQSNAEKVVTWISDNVQIPFLQGTIKTVLEKLFGFGADRERTKQVNNMTHSFPNLQQAGAIVEVLARYLTLTQKEDIIKLMKPTQRTRLQTFIDQIKKAVKWIQASDITTPARAFAAEQAETLVDHLMDHEATRSLTLKDIPTLASVATKGKVTANLATSAPTFSSTATVLNVVAITQQKANAGVGNTNNVPGIDPTLFAKTASTAEAADSKATAAVEEARAAQQEAAKLNEQVKTLEAESSRTKAKMKNLDTLGEILWEMDAGEDKKQINVSAVDRLDIGFSRLQARDEAGRRIVTEEMMILKETVAQLQEEVQALKEQKKSQKRSGFNFLKGAAVVGQQNIPQVSDPSSVTATQATQFYMQSVDYRQQLLEQPFPNANTQQRKNPTSNFSNGS